MPRRTPDTLVEGFPIDRASAQLPGPTRQKLRHTLSQWRQWHCDPPLQEEPEVIRQLPSGISNTSVLVGGESRFVVRIDGVVPAHHGLNRQFEWRTLLDASRAGLAPTPRYFNPDLGSLVCDYLPPDESVDTSAAEIAQLMRAIHALPPRHHKLDLYERIARYEKHAAQAPDEVRAVLATHRKQVLELAQQVREKPGSLVLCHNDLLLGNRLRSNGRLYALDWEYCAMAQPLYDVAVVIEGDGMADAEAEVFMEAYLQRPPRPVERRQVNRYRCIYRYLEILWFLSIGRPAVDGAALQQMAQALSSRVREANNN